MGVASITFLLTKCDCAHFIDGWRFCYNSMTVSAISFKPQKVCTTMVTPCTDRFSSHSFKQFALWPLQKIVYNSLVFYPKYTKYGL